MRRYYWRYVMIPLTLVKWDEFVEKLRNSGISVAITIPEFCIGSVYHIYREGYTSFNVGYQFMQIAEAMGISHDDVEMFCNENDIHLYWQK
jgi:hypothetical protein